jgi:hypothetical protein
MILTDEHIRLIRAKVDEAGTLKALADEIGVYPQTVGRWISGEAKEVKGRNIKKLMSALGIDSSSLYPSCGIANLSILRDRAAIPTACHNWFAFGEWAQRQPDSVQDVIIAVAKSHGYTIQE